MVSINLPEDNNPITPRDDKTISIVWDYPRNFPRYAKFNDVRSNPNLPANFKKKFESYFGKVFDSADLFTDIKSTPNQAVYCTEVNRHIFYYAPDQSEVPTSNINTADKRSFITYVLSHGQKTYLPDNEEAIKREIATQLAVWLVAEGVYTSASYDSPAIDSVLGGRSSPTAQFAPTRDIGDMARALLDAARLNAANPSPPPLHPSFASATEILAPEHAMMTTGSGAYFLDLTDTNNILWDYPEALTIGAGSLGYTVSGSTLHLTGDPGAYSGTLITIGSDYAGGTVLYLSTEKTETGTGEPMQKMARFARVEGVSQTYYLRVYRTADAPDPGGPTVDQLIHLNDTVAEVVNGAAKIEAVLQEKLSIIIDLLTHA